MHKVFKLGVCILALQAGACATIIEGSDQTIAVSTVDKNGGIEIAGAECTLTSASIGSHRVMTPGSVMLPKSKNNVNVVCNKDGYEAGTGSVTSHFAAATVGNLLIGGLIGVGIDAASGASNKYDERIVVTMDKKPEPAPTPTPKPVMRRAAKPAGS